MKDTNYIRISLYCKVKNTFILTITSLFFIATTPVFADSFSVATQNAYNFYNDKNDGKREKVLSPKNYQLRLSRMSKHIAKTLNAPNILALQEVENFATLNDLKIKLKQQYNLCYQPVLLDGHKKVSINVAYLVACEWTINNVSQLFKNTRLKRSNKQLFTRPPLYLNVCKGQHCVHLVNIHLRSMRGLNRKKKRHYVAQKRLQQAEKLARWIEQFQTQWPNKKLLVLGDFNALNISDRHVDVLGIIKGSPARYNEQYTSTDLITRNLFDLSHKVSKSKRFSYRYKGKKQSLDYILISQNLVRNIDRVKFSPIHYKVSDHAGVMAQFSLK